MKIAPLNIINTMLNKGAKAPNIDDLRAAKRFANCALDNLERKLLSSVEAKAPSLVQSISGEKYIPDDTIPRRAVSSLKSFFGIPLDIIDSIAKKFPNSKLNNAEFLQNYRASVQLEENIHALQGLRTKGAKFAQEYMTAHGLTEYQTGPCGEYCESICGPVTNKFLEQLNNTMADNVANYDTKKERFATRLISGLTAALFLGSDFYNKSIKKGKTEEEAKKEQHLKQGQEIKENICEAITQFAVFSCFSKTINKSPWAPAIIGTCIGLVSRVVSRLSSGMRITRMDVQERPATIIPSLNEFLESAKTGSTEELLIKKQENQIEEIKKEHKKPILSAKNLIGFCAASIIGGYLLRFGKNHTNIGQNITKLLKQYAEKSNKKNVKEIFATQEHLEKLESTLRKNGNKKFGESIYKIMDKNTDDKGNVYLGTDYVTKKLFGIEVKAKDLRDLKTAPLKFIKELVSYPYKIASKLEEAIKNSKLTPKEKALLKKPDLTEDILGIRNLYTRFLEFEEKYGSDEAKLTKEFGEYVNKMLLKSNNDVTSSKGDNSKIAVMAQTLGTLSGMWFNMNDEFNSSVRNGSTKKEAEKDARLRGINKFFRMTVQIIISGSLNEIFKKQYNNSIANSALVVVASTVLTDMASRILSGMPSKKMSKEGLEQYQKDHKEGVMAWYYKAIDKLAS